MDTEEIRQHRIHACCDVEGHKGLDNRFYLVGTLKLWLND